MSLSAMDISGVCSALILNHLVPLPIDRTGHNAIVQSVSSSTSDLQHLNHVEPPGNRGGIETRSSGRC